MYSFLLLMIRLPLRSTLFPYTTLFRSVLRRTAPGFGGRHEWFQLFPFRIREVGVIRGSREFHSARVEEYPFQTDRKSTRLNSSHSSISYAVFCLKKKIIKINNKLCHKF